MRNINEDTITQAVLAAMSGCRDNRLRTVMTGLIQHLHSFATEVKLTEDEWRYAIDFLTRVGHITDDRRQEFVLLSDTLGLSMLVTTQNNRKASECTEATVLGPFFVNDAPSYENGQDISNGARGSPCFVIKRPARHIRYPVDEDISFLKKFGERGVEALVDFHAVSHGGQHRPKSPFTFFLAVK